MIKTLNSQLVGPLELDSTLPNVERARELLETLRRNIEPILRRRGWRVLQLVEISKKKNRWRNAVGWCSPVGDATTAEKIAIELRKGWTGQFKSFQDLMGTMIHELAHIVHLQHRAPFYRLMDELEEEWGMLVTEGKILDAGGFPTKGGYKIGGCKSGSKKGVNWGKLSQRESAALAAERRAADAAAGFGDEELWPGLKEALQASAHDSALSNAQDTGLDLNSKRQRQADIEEQRELEQAIAASRKTLDEWPGLEEALRGSAQDSALNPNLKRQREVAMEEALRGSAQDSALNPNLKRQRQVTMEEEQRPSQDSMEEAIAASRTMMPPHCEDEGLQLAMAISASSSSVDDSRVHEEHEALRAAIVASLSDDDPLCQCPLICIECDP